MIFLNTIVLPQYFEIGFFKIHYYGLIMALAVAAAYWLAIKLSLKFNIIFKEAERIIFISLIGGFLGARFYHVITSINFYWKNSGEIYKIWNGGLSIYGAVFGGVISIIYILKKYKINTTLLNVLNWLSAPVLIGQIIGRFGNLFNYELYGYPTSLPWKMFVPFNFRLPGYQHFLYFHPLFLYEALGNTIILLYLMAKIRQGNTKTLFLWYLLLYNCLRFGLEFLRIDSVFLGPIRVNAIVSLLLCIAAILTFILIKNGKISQNNIGNN